MSKDNGGNVVDINSKKKSASIGGAIPPTRLPPPPDGLPVDDYVFYLVNKIDQKEEIVVKTGHLVVTQSNIVLFDQNQNMIWGIPNDSALIMFERLDPIDEDDEVEVDFISDFDDEDE